MLWCKLISTNPFWISLRVQFTLAESKDVQNRLDKREDSAPFLFQLDQRLRGRKSYEANFFMNYGCTLFSCFKIRRFSLQAFLLWRRNVWGMNLNWRILSFFLHGFEVKVSGYKKVPESKVEIMWKVTKQFTPKPPDSSHFLHHFRGNLNLKLQPLCFPFHTSNVWSLALGVNDLFP